MAQTIFEFAYTYDLLKAIITTVEKMPPSFRYDELKFTDIMKNFNVHDMHEIFEEIDSPIVIENSQGWDKKKDGYRLRNPKLDKILLLNFLQNKTSELAAKITKAL